ncbi:hypothetical protein CSB45_02520 [candidate division KSB3 bacterium]|uniref:Uncharacterized protein n=1 Tax=candidate division KSB3 bacterium TaxID=2044937 RepID=A0A2G6E9X7_9BACT|nr:MAG: hypothetical protein CSB45_02520 [candidate division KSB3 bacterium]PIE30954.1 MAG: hypothetical protein CSA57_01135 [candidate division KSB3 bacterium]
MPPVPWSLFFDWLIQIVSLDQMLFSAEPEEHKLNFTSREYSKRKHQASNQDSQLLSKIIRKQL